MKTREIALAVLLVQPTIAGAADVPVSYIVNQKELKQTQARKTVTFDLYVSKDCANPVASRDANVEELLIEKVVTFKVKNGPPAPSIARLNYVLSDEPGSVIPEAPIYYVEVAGTGIVPFGSTCQAQLVPGRAGGSNIPCQRQEGNEVFFDGCNVNIRSGSGSTDGPVNGLGNLVIGYNGATVAGSPPGTPQRTGSHNVVVGNAHSYASYAGLLGGYNSTITSLAPYASVTGGKFNSASAPYAAVSSGQFNTATGENAWVGGGLGNRASGKNAAVSAGIDNLASGENASVSAGDGNVASGTNAAVSGGESNTASGENASVSGGSQNVASGTAASVSGGQANRATGENASATGGQANTVAGVAASVNGGTNNDANAKHSAIGGGLGLVIPDTGVAEWHAGRTAGYPTSTAY